MSQPEVCGRLGLPGLGGRGSHADQHTRLPASLGKTQHLEVSAGSMSGHRCI